MTSWIVNKCDACGKESRDTMAVIQFYRLELPIETKAACSTKCAIDVLRSVADALDKLPKVAP